MKKLFTIGALLAVAVTVVIGQEFLSRKPRPSELDKVSGLDYFLQFQNPKYQVYLPGSEEQYDIILGGSNMNVIFGSDSTSNVQVRLPNCSNSVGATFQFIAGANVRPRLTNVYGNMFTDVTNFYAGLSNNVASWTMQSNSAVTVVTPNGTNWFVIPEH